MTKYEHVFTVDFYLYSDREWSTMTKEEILEAFKRQAEYYVEHPDELKEQVLIKGTHDRSY